MSADVNTSSSYRPNSTQSESISDYNHSHTPRLSSQGTCCTRDSRRCSSSLQSSSPSPLYHDHSHVGGINNLQTALKLLRVTVQRSNDLVVLRLHCLYFSSETVHRRLQKWTELARLWKPKEVFIFVQRSTIITVNAHSVCYITSLSACTSFCS